MIQTITRRHLCFTRVVEGDLETPYRERCESTLFNRLAAAGVRISMVSIHDGGCAFAVDEHDVAGLRKATDSLNVALTVRARCARISITQRVFGSSFLFVSCVIAAMAKAGIAIVHLFAGTGELAVLVDGRDATRAQAVLADCAAVICESSALAR